jgi:AcrR family transcriptional regulator
VKSTVQSSPQERILQAALGLLETGGVEAVSTRAVSAAADVQPPTIYRHFGDMQGLLNAVASAGFAAYLEAKGTRATYSDPVQQLRDGWNLHLEFGLTHPHLYTLMYAAATKSGTQGPAALEGFAILRTLLQRVAEAGRLAVSVERAAAMIHGAAMGLTLSLLSAPVRDDTLSDLMLEAVLNAILTPEPSQSRAQPETSVVRSQATAHAVSLAALLPELQVPFSAAERSLLAEWLDRLM